MASIVGTAEACALLGACAVTSADTKRLIVAFNTSAAAAIRGAVSAARGRAQLEIFGLAAMAVEVLTQALNGLARNPNVEYVEEDVKHYPLSGTTPSTGTPYASAQLVPNGIKLVQADELSDRLAGNCKVCNIDSCYNRGVEDLDASTNVSGEYDSGTGRWCTDENHHGTHVAGTIAALNNAGTGVIGVNPNQQLTAGPLAAAAWTERKRGDAGWRCIYSRMRQTRHSRPWRFFPKPISSVCRKPGKPPPPPHAAPVLRTAPGLETRTPTHQPC